MHSLYQILTLRLAVSNCSGTVNKCLSVLEQLPGGAIVAVSKTYALRMTISCWQHMVLSATSADSSPESCKTCQMFLWLKSGHRAIAKIIRRFEPIYSSCRVWACIFRGFCHEQSCRYFICKYFETGFLHPVSGCPIVHGYGLCVYIGETSWIGMAIRGVVKWTITGFVFGSEGWGDGSVGRWWQRGRLCIVYMRGLLIDSCN